MSARTLASLFASTLLLALGASADAGSLFVANNGADGIGCGSKTAPCRSITQAIANAQAGDRIVVGPGRYGDLDGNGTLSGPGEESGAPGCGCLLAVNKPLSIASSDGAAATVIDAHTVDLLQNVLLITENATFGSPGKGFLVSGTANVDGKALVIDSNQVAVRGNQVVGPGITLHADAGIATVDASETILIEANQVIGWDVGIDTMGSGKTVRKNQVALNRVGIAAGSDCVVESNVVTGNGNGILNVGATTMAGNAVRGNPYGVVLDSPATIERNDFVGNGNGLWNQSNAAQDAGGNYWGAPSGPGIPPADSVHDEVGSGPTTAVPFATKPFKVKAPIKP